MKAMIFQDVICSILVGNFKKHNVLVFGLTLMQTAIEGCHYPKLVEEELKLELVFSL